MVVVIKNIIKPALLLCLFWLVLGTAKGQEADTLAIEGTDTLLTKGKVMETRWLMLDIGWNSFIYNNTDIDNSPFHLNRAKSLQFNLNIFRQRISLYKRKLNLEYGFVLDFNRYELKNPYTLSPYSTTVDPVFMYSSTANPPLPDTVSLDDFFIGELTFDTLSYKRNSLHTASLTIPLLFQFESNPNKKRKSFHLGAGGYFGLIVGAKNKQRTAEQKLNTKGNFNLPDFKYGIQTELGFSYFTLIYKLELSPFFSQSEDAGYRMQAMTIGVRLIPYF